MATCWRFRLGRVPDLSPRARVQGLHRQPLRHGLSAKVLADYFDFFFDGPRAAAVLDAYPHDFVLIPPTAPVRALMERRPDWKLIYGDSNALLFARTDSPAARFDGVPIRGRPPPDTFP